MIWTVCHSRTARCRWCCGSCCAGQQSTSRRRCMLPSWLPWRRWVQLHTQIPRRLGSRWRWQPASAARCSYHCVAPWRREVCSPSTGAHHHVLCHNCVSATCRSASFGKRAPSSTFWSRRLQRGPLQQLQPQAALAGLSRSCSLQCSSWHLSCRAPAQWMAAAKTPTVICRTHMLRCSRRLCCSSRYCCAQMDAKVSSLPCC